MSDTTARALRLLSLLQTHRHWTSTELGERLGITSRTVRRDIDRLRELGYRIESEPGVAGGYRLEAGNALPPLLLSDDEAVAIAIGLRIAASQRLVDGPQTTLSALAKLEQVLPPALRRRVAALAEVVPSGPGGGARVSPELLGDLALACRDHERLRFDYTSVTGEASSRRVEPHSLAPAERNWYLVCWDLDREDWRTFRVDRIERLLRTRVLAAPRELAEETVAEMVLAASSWSPQHVEADVVMDLGFEDFRGWFGHWGQGATPEGADRTRWPVGGSDWREAMYGMLYVPAGVPYRTDLAEPHRGELREAVARLLAALEAAPPEPRATEAPRPVRGGEIAG
ncbi:helix-turn-helix transcriptional regulator [Agromyces seonyuensis]|uniref:WYL domain-containing protein n=1 Tax=Agromyces seonyuensis TaxID=2662446 RepID=A0A6I4P0A6_9MICO|nr:transcriptional regulator [Agromyces seonyuensis]MWB98922.1 WYL domain-containing protein [Agromyces seonyuensis]